MNEHNYNKPLDHLMELLSDLKGKIEFQEELICNLIYYIETITSHNVMEAYFPLVRTEVKLPTNSNVVYCNKIKNYRMNHFAQVKK